MKPITSGGCEITIEGRTIVKRGPKTIVAADHAAYAYMGRILGDAYPRFFPRVLGFTSTGNDGELKLERVAGDTLEALALCAKGFAATYERVETGLSGALRLYYQMSAKGALLPISTTNKAARNLFFEEIVAALTEIDIDDGFIALINEKRDQLLRPFVASACHRDLGLHNIVADRNCSVRFIDPKPALANGDFGGYGSPAYDLAKLTVSLERVNEIRSRRSGTWSRLSIERFAVSAMAEDLIERGAFTQEFFGLCRLLAYAKYAACRCAFCEQYPFLYEEMGRNAVIYTRMLRDDLTRPQKRKGYNRGGYPH